MRPARGIVAPAVLLVLLAVRAWELAPVPALPAWAVPVASLLALGVMVAGRPPLRVGLAAGTALVLLGAYLLNPTHEWTAGAGLLPVAHRAGCPGTADPADTWSAFWVLAGMAGAFGLAFQLKRRPARGLLRILGVGGAVMALAVLLQRLDVAAGSAGGRIGLFVNENHFAVTANLLLPVLLALADRARFRAVQEGRPSSPAGLWLLASALVAAAVVASRSRAGIAVMTVLVGAHVVHRFRLVRQYPFMGIPQGRVAKWAGGLAVAAALAFAIAAFAREWRHVAGLLGEGTFRFGLLRDTLAVWRDSPVWGTGPGTFTTVFPYYQSVLFEGRVILHAHCEPVQWLAESGWAGGGILLAAAWMALGARRRNPENGPEEIPPFAELERNAVGWALAALAVHILIDFPLRIPLIALGAAVWAGLWAGQRPSRPTGT